MNCGGIIDMRVCQQINCLSRLTNRMKEHKKKRGKEHKCNDICNRQLTEIHKEYHQAKDQATIDEALNLLGGHII